MLSGIGQPGVRECVVLELATVRGPMGLPVERDEHYHETRPLSVIAKLAQRAGHMRV
jgi:hypothetical protein